MMRSGGEIGQLGSALTNMRRVPAAEGAAGRRRRSFTYTSDAVDRGSGKTHSAHGARSANAAGRIVRVTYLRFQGPRPPSTRRARARGARAAACRTASADTRRDSMDWSDSPEQAAFRAGSAHVHHEQAARPVPRSSRPRGRRRGHCRRLAARPQVRRRRARTRPRPTGPRALAEKGWVAPHWPKEYGGAGPQPDRAVHLQRRRWPRPGAPAVGGRASACSAPR